jgi:hypothetical protein
MPRTVVNTRYLPFIVVDEGAHGHVHSVFKTGQRGPDANNQWTLGAFVCGGAQYKEAAIVAESLCKAGANLPQKLVEGQI